MPSVTINIADRGTPRAIKTVWRLLFALVVFLPCLASCANGAHIPKPPLMLPFEVQKAGSKVETELRITEGHLYSFTLKFMHKVGDRVDVEHVRELAGGNEKDRYGELINQGATILLKLKISRIDAQGEILLHEIESSEQPLYSWGSDSFNKKISDIFLMPGDYKIYIENLRNIPELKETKINFAIVSTYSGK